MSKGTYNGGSTIIGPGSRYFSETDGVNAPKKVDPELKAIMEAHDKLRTRGINPMTAFPRKGRR